MADLAALKTELDTDPLTRGYAGMTDLQAADDLSTVYRTRNRELLTGDEMFTATDNTDFTGLSDHERSLWISWCNTDRDPFNSANVAFVQYIFGGGSTTVTNLSSIRLENVSRAEELDLGDVQEGTVAQARAL